MKMNFELERKYGYLEVKCYLEATPGTAPSGHTHFNTFDNGTDTEIEDFHSFEVKTQFRDWKPASKELAAKLEDHVWANLNSRSIDNAICSAMEAG